MRPLIAGAIAMLTGGSSAGLADAMRPTFGNTVVTVRSDGKEMHTFYRENHTFTGRIPAINFLYKGSWKIDAKGNLCRWYDPPMPVRTNPECSPFVAHGVGDRWTSPEGTKGSLAEGIQ